MLMKRTGSMKGKQMTSIITNLMYWEVTGKTKVEMAKKTGKMIEDMLESESKKGRPVSISRQRVDFFHSFVENLHV